MSNYIQIGVRDGMPELPTIENLMNPHSKKVDVDFLFPNGIYIRTPINYFSPMDQIKVVSLVEV